MAGILPYNFGKFKENKVSAKRSSSFGLLCSQLYTDSTFSAFAGDDTGGRFYAVSTTYPSNISRVGAPGPTIRLRFEALVDIKVALCTVHHDDMRTLTRATRGVTKQVNKGAYWDYTDPYPVISTNAEQSVTIMGSAFAVIVADVNQSANAATLQQMEAVRIHANFTLHGFSDDISVDMANGEIALNKVPDISKFAVSIPRQLVIRTYQMAEQVIAVPILQNSFPTYGENIGIVGYVLAKASMRETNAAILQDFVDIGIPDDITEIELVVGSTVGFGPTSTLRRFTRMTGARLTTLLSQQWAFQDNGMVGYVRIFDGAAEALIVNFAYFTESILSGTAFVAGQPGHLMSPGTELDPKATVRSLFDAKPKRVSLPRAATVGRTYTKVSPMALSTIEPSNFYSITDTLQLVIDEKEYLPGIIEFTKLPTSVSFDRTWED